MVGFLAALVVLVLAIGLVLWLGIEMQFKQRPGNRLELEPGKWTLVHQEPQHYVIEGEPALVNLTRSLEIMVPEISVETQLLSGASLKGVTVDAQIVPMHTDAPARPDGYWFAYIVKTAQSTGLKVKIDIQGPDLSALKALWVKVHYLTYGPEGRVPKTGHVVVPLRFPEPGAAQNWRETSRAKVLPIPTHLLGPLDTPLETVKRYVQPYAQPGDIVTIGETPVAIMQGRWRHPSEVKPGWVARRICYFFMPTSSLATACGMQTLVDLVGPVRVVYAFVVGAIAKKFFGRAGMFYQLAGDQARLIDDVTGTLPPYDQFIVLGPKKPEQIVQEIFDATGLRAAIVDVNDLKAVKILAATPGTDTDLVASALVDNPAGNADEQTPVVLIHPRA